jgi:uridine kinase
MTTSSDAQSLTPRISSVDDLLAEIRARVGDASVFVVSFDGRSGAGKSTLASVVASALGATIVPSDDFFAAELPDAEWDRRTAEQRAADAIDWRRLRQDALEPLRKGLPARWFAFDFFAGARPDGTYPMLTMATERPPNKLVILDGAYSSRAELTDLIDLSVLVEVEPAERLRRLAAREDAAFLESWHARWDGAEEHYFSRVRPPASFDLVFHASASGRL